MTEQEWREEFSARLKRIRHQNKKYNQKQLAEATELTDATISNYNKTKRMPDAKTLVKLAQVLNCTIDDLIYVDEEIK